jgi:hypothetical protein
MEKNNYTKEEVLQLMYQAFESGFKKYEVVDAGLESIETKEECGWILRRYDSDLEKEIQKETQKQLITEIMNEDAKDGLYKKQTAVEWLEKEFVKLEATIGVYSKMYEIIEQAKEMEKQQIVEAYRLGHIFHDSNDSNSAQEYYDTEYGKQ